MDEAPRTQDPWEIHTPATNQRERVRVLKCGDTFGVYDALGDIRHIGSGEQGLYDHDTRFLSAFVISVNGRRPVLLNSALTKDNTLLTVDLTVPDLEVVNGAVIEQGTIHLFRARLLWERVQYDHLRLRHFGDRPAAFALAFHYAADYADLFEVRGTRRARRGELLATTHEAAVASLRYLGLDGRERRTHLHFSQPPSRWEPQRAVFEVVLHPGDDLHLYVTASCEMDGVTSRVIEYKTAHDLCTNRSLDSRSGRCTIVTSNTAFNDWLARSSADLQMLLTDGPGGAYPFAGVPWFSAPFGRDGLVTALQVLWLDPSIARGVLEFLAAHQADVHDRARDAEPGKVIHEMRSGEMAELGEVPFGRYYGSVDATPLFVVLAGAYLGRTGDRAFVQKLWPHVERALHWIDCYGDRDADGFVEYERQSENGLRNQGWKDSANAVFHRNGVWAEPPIAMCEVQGYVYSARRAAAQLARAMGLHERAHALTAQARLLRVRFERAFWCEELETYALALDRDKAPCRVRTSNAGHALFAGIARADRATRLVRTLFSSHSFSGWGIRTLAEGEPCYNPMSYHNGSVWPHDNAMIASGLAAYGFKDEALRLLQALFDAARSIELSRLPELMCGFMRRQDQGPTLYPVACSPQAWASGSIFQVLQACLGLTFSADKPHIRFDRPRLPAYLGEVRLENLQVGAGQVDVILSPHPRRVSVSVARVEGDVEVAVTL